MVNITLHFITFLFIIPKSAIRQALHNHHLDAYIPKLLGSTKPVPGRPPRR